MAEVDCALVAGKQALLARIFGHGAAPGLLHWLGDGGTLMISNAQGVGGCGTQGCYSPPSCGQVPPPQPPKHLRQATLPETPFPFARCNIAGRHRPA